jgi:hypothetical protein
MKEYCRGEGGEEYATYNKKKEGELDWLCLAWELPSEGCY